MDETIRGSFELKAFRSQIDEGIEKIYDDRWKRVKELYGKVYLHKFPSDHIGEVVAQYTNILYDENYRTKKGKHVFIPHYQADKGKICNEYLFEIIGRKIELINEDNINFWSYVVRKYHDSLDYSMYHRFFRVRKDEAYCCPIGKNHFDFSEEERKLGERRVRDMNLTEQFVCVHIRDANYRKVIEKKDYDISFNKIRNCKAEDFGKSIDFLKNKNIQCIRMGKFADRAVKKQDWIDYAGDYQHDFMDLYLLSKCKFMLGTASGLTSIASTLGRPTITTNKIPQETGDGSSVFHKEDLFIPKKYWSDKKKRFLNLWEMYEIDARCYVQGEIYNQYGIEMVDNTDEEILDVVKEMNDRLDGVWVQTEEDEYLQERYTKIRDFWYRTRHRNRMCGLGLMCRIGAAFLRKNSWFLDVGISLEDKI